MIINEQQIKTCPSSFCLPRMPNRSSITPKFTIAIEAIAKASVSRIFENEAAAKSDRMPIIKATLMIKLTKTAIPPQSAIGSL
jgi:hypothetical protein